MPARTSTAVWNGDLESGTGQMVVGNNAYTGDFSFKSRFEEGAGTNPEELIAAAHAGCYSMQLSAMLAGAGKNPTSVSTKAHVTLQIVDEKPTITKIALDTVGVVPGGVPGHPGSRGCRERHPEGRARGLTGGLTPRCGAPSP